MATVRVSFLLGGERFHGRLNRYSVLSDVPAKATRLNRAGPGCKFIRLRRLSHTRQFGMDHAVFLRRDDGGSHFPFAFSPSSTKRRMASGLVGTSTCLRRHSELFLDDGQAASTGGLVELSYQLRVGRLDDP
jgi:hypothetical protein